VAVLVLLVNSVGDVSVAFYATQHHMCLVRSLPAVVNNSGVVFASVCWQAEAVIVCTIRSVYVHENKKLTDVGSRWEMR
jgi:hypothetical protein